GDGFLLNDAEAKKLLALSDADYRDVVRPYVIGEDLTTRPDQSPSRWIVDFASRPLEQATKYPTALDIVRRAVKPERDVNRDKGFREKWWHFGRPRGEMRKSLASRDRDIVGTATGKRLLLAWQPSGVCPSNAVNVFAVQDSYSMG